MKNLTDSIYVDGAGEERNDEIADESRHSFGEIGIFQLIRSGKTSSQFESGQMLK